MLYDEKREVLEILNFSILFGTLKSMSPDLCLNLMNFISNSSLINFPNIKNLSVFLNSVFVSSTNIVNISRGDKIYYDFI